jgi:hypothetical protein
MCHPLIPRQRHVSTTSGRQAEDDVNQSWQFIMAHDLAQYHSRWLDRYRPDRGQGDTGLALSETAIHVLTDSGQDDRGLKDRPETPCGRAGRPAVGDFPGVDSKEAPGLRPGLC